MSERQQKGQKENQQTRDERYKEALKRAEERAMKAKERGARVIVPSCPEMLALVQVVEQLNDHYAQLKATSGPFNLINQKKCQEAQENIVSVVFQTALETEKIAKLLPGRTRFFLPRVMEKAYGEFKNALRSQLQAPLDEDEVAKPPKKSETSSEKKQALASKKSSAKVEETVLEAQAAATA